MSPVSGPGFIFRLIQISPNVHILQIQIFESGGLSLFSKSVQFYPSISNFKVHGRLQMGIIFLHYITYLYYYVTLYLHISYCVFTLLYYVIRIGISIIIYFYAIILLLLLLLLLLLY